VFAGVRNGFGNVVMIQHGGVYTTLYGHMSKIGVKNGVRVSQGQIIGAVGHDRLGVQALTCIMNFMLMEQQLIPWPI
jgi:septal ring factor EnvC (AmiA/AmiB activator)